MKILVTQTSETVEFTNQIKAQFEQVTAIDLNNASEQLMDTILDKDVLIIPINKQQLKLIPKNNWEILKRQHEDKKLKVLPVQIEETSWLYMPYAAVFPVFPNDKTILTDGNLAVVFDEIKSYLTTIDSSISKEFETKEEGTASTKTSSIFKESNLSQSTSILAKAKEAEAKENFKYAITCYEEMLHFTTNAVSITKYKEKISALNTKIELNDWITKGRNAYKKGDFEIALKAFEKAASIEDSEKLQKTIKKIASQLRQKKIEENIRKSKRTKWYAVLGALIFAIGILFLVRYINRPKPIIVDTDVVEVGYPMVMVEGKTFEMGSNSYDNQTPRHEVILDDFYIGKYEVTVELYDAYCQDQDLPFVNLSTGNPRGKTAMTHISWFDACRFANWLSKQNGYSAAYIIVPDGVLIDAKSNGYRLPTEAQWEFAAIGGRVAKRYTYSGGNYMNDVSWNAYNSQKEVQKVGQKKPNELGIYDMSGNVWEWCWDWHEEGYYHHESKNPSGSDFGYYRIMRGGSWFSEDFYLRPRTRMMDVPTTRDVDLGFRLVRPVL